LRSIVENKKYLLNLVKVVHASTRLKSLFSVMVVVLFALKDNTNKINHVTTALINVFIMLV
jgi:hypothetical protein